LLPNIIFRKGGKMNSGSVPPFPKLANACLVAIYPAVGLALYSFFLSRFLFFVF
jgi:hypothetical protein